MNRLRTQLRRATRRRARQLHAQPWQVGGLIVAGAVILLLAFAVVKGQSAADTAQANARQNSLAAAQAARPTPPRTKKQTQTSPQTPATVDWHAPSETKPYPDVARVPDFNIAVDLAAQRVYLKSGEQTLYTMYASTGMDNSTPRGNFRIQNERGLTFYNPNEGMGANYYTSFYQHGVYLFHSVPTDIAGNYLPDEAAKIGLEPASHGCVRLTIADAKWIHDTVPTETPVSVY